MIWRVVAVLLAVGLGGAGIVSFALGTCHDSGGSCSDEFSSTNVEGYAGGVALLSACVALVALTFTRRVVPVVAAALSSAVVLAAPAIGLEAAR